MPGTAVRESMLRLALAGSLDMVGMTLEQYHEAIATGGIVESNCTELIDGLLVRKDRSAAGEDPMTVGDRHRVAVLRFARLLPKFEALGHFVQTQMPISLPPNHEPEPDAAIVRGGIDDFLDHAPGPADLLCVIEVADSSLLRDTTTKLRMYAAAGIAEYVVVDLQHDVVLVHRHPCDGNFASPVVHRRGETLALPAGEARSIELPVDTLL